MGIRCHLSEFYIHGVYRYCLLSPWFSIFVQIKEKKIENHCLRLLVYDLHSANKKNHQVMTLFCIITLNYLKGALISPSVLSLWVILFFFRKDGFCYWWSFLRLFCHRSMRICSLRFQCMLLMLLHSKKSGSNKNYETETDVLSEPSQPDLRIYKGISSQDSWCWSSYIWNYL